MAKGINIGIASDARDFMSGVKSGVITPLENVSDVLEDVARDGDKAGDKLDAAFRDQQRSTSELTKDYKSLNREIQDGSSTSARHMQRASEDSTRKSKEGFEEIKESSRSNATEVAASFDGSAQSISDGFQGLTAEVFAGFGPAGVVAGVAAAAGIGLVSTAMQQGQEDTEAFKADVSDLADDLVSTGSRGSASLTKIVSTLQALATGEDSAGNTLGKLRTLAKDTGISYADLAKAYAGNANGLDRLLAQQKRHLTALQDQRIAQNDVTGGINRAPSAITKQIEAQEKLIGTLENTSKKQKAAAREQKDYIDSGAEALDRQAQAASDYSSGVQAAYAAAGSSVDDYVKDGVFNLDEYSKATKKNADDLVAYQANMATAVADLAKGGHDEAISYLESLGPDAAPLIAAFIKAPAAQQKDLEATWDTLGSAASSAFGTRLQNNLTAQETTHTVTLVPDDSQIVNRLAFLKRNPSSVPVSLIPTGSLGSGVRVP